MSVREPSANFTELEYEVRKKEDIIPRFPVMWSVTLESIIQVCNIDDLRQDIRVAVWARV